VAEPPPNPRVSFVVPTYNYGRFVAQAIESLLGQTFRELEVIVIDDASVDDTQTVLERYRTDPRVRLVRHTENSGHIRTYNEGLSIARGEFMGLLSADDLCLHPEAVARQVAMFDSDPEVGFVYAAMALVDESGTVLSVRRPWPEDQVRDGLTEFGHLVFHNYVPASGPLVRRSCHEEVGYYDARLPHAGDWDLWLRLTTRYRVGYVAEALYGYRLHGVNMHHQDVGSPQACAENVLTVSRAIAALPASAPPDVRGLRGAALRHVGLRAVDWERQWGRTSRSWGHAWHALRHSPGLAVTPSYYVALSKLMVVTLLGRRAAARLATLRSRAA
jgi:glycosyltransferase involved in cell wall biosynthesis